MGYQGWGDRQTMSGDRWPGHVGEGAGRVVGESGAGAMVCVMG